MKVPNKITYFSVSEERYMSLLGYLTRRCVPLRMLEKAREIIKGEGVYYNKDFDETKSIFVHIPKAAGTSVAKALYGERKGHHTAIAYKKSAPYKFKKYFVFTFVRNPWDRLLSTYTYLLKSPHVEDSSWAKDNLSQYEDFNDFVHNWVNENNILTWKHFLPQSYFVCDPVDGSVMVDYIGRVENIKEDFNRISVKIGIHNSIGHENVSDRADYRKVYDAKSVEIVSRVYKEDIENFDYTF